MLASFEALLESHTDVLHVGRTAKALLAHWQLMKQYSLLQDQSPQPRLNSSREFSEVEEQVKLKFWILLKLARPFSFHAYFHYLFHINIFVCAVGGQRPAGG